MTAPISTLPANPQLKDVLDQFRKDMLINFNCHHLATIQGFSADEQMATATINYKKSYYEKNDATGVYKQVLVDYPVLIDCPVIFLGGGKSALTFPVKVGDECIVLFNDRDIDNWFFGGRTGSAPPTGRLHSFTDGIILVGLRSQQNVIKNFDTSRVVLRNDKALVGVGPSLIKVANDQYTLNSVLQELLTELQDLTQALALLTVICANPGSPSSVPVNAVDITAIGTRIGTTATKIAGLLE